MKSLKKLKFLWKSIHPLHKFCTPLDGTIGPSLLDFPSTPKGSCNDNYRVMVKISSSYHVYAISPQSTVYCNPISKFKPVTRPFFFQRAYKTSDKNLSIDLLISRSHGLSMYTLSML